MKKDNKELISKLFLVAFPIMLQSLVQSGLGFLDTLMIGQLGEAEVAAIGGANQFYLFLQMAFFGLNSGGSIFLAQYFGAKNLDEMRKVTTFTTVISIIIGTLGWIFVSFFPLSFMSLFSQDERVIETGIVYLRTVGFSYIFVGFSMMYSGAFRAMGDAKTPMYTTVFSLFLNAVLNALLIFGLGPFPRLGVFGGALATVISRLTEALLLIIISIRRKAPFVTRRREDFKWDKSFIKAMGSTGLPAFLHETLWSIGSILYKISYSSLGTAAFAAFNIDMTIQDLFFVAGLGLANGSGVILGNIIGEGDKEKAQRWSMKIILYTLSIGVFMSIMELIISPMMISLYNISPEAVSTAVKALFSFSFLLPFEMTGVVIMVGILRSGGDSRYSLLSEIIPMYLLSIPLAFIGSKYLHLSLWAILLFKLSEIIPKMIIGGVRVRSGKWIKDLSLRER